MAISSELGAIYTSLTDFAGLSGGSEDYDQVSSVAIQFGSQFLTFDVIKSRTHRGEIEVTDHPIESGAAVTDQAVPQPYAIDIEGFVTQTPIVGGTLISTPLDVAVWTAPFSPTPGGIYAAAGQGISAIGNALLGAPAPPKAQILTFDTPFDAVGDTLYQLQQFHDNATLLTLITSETTYDAVVMTSFEVEKTPDTGTGANVNMSFRVLNVVETSTASAPMPAPSVVRGAVPVNVGVQAPTPSPVAESWITDAAQYLIPIAKSVFGS